MGIEPVSGQGAVIASRMSALAAERGDAADGAECGDDAGEHSAMLLAMHGAMSAVPSPNSVSMSSPERRFGNAGEARHGGQTVDAERLHRRPAHRRPSPPAHGTRRCDPPGRRAAATPRAARRPPPAPGSGPRRPSAASACCRIDAGLARRPPRSAVTPRSANACRRVRDRRRARISIQVGPARRRRDQLSPSAACADGCRRPRAPPGWAGSRAAGRSAPDRRPAPCRRRPSPRRAGRAARAPPGARPRR